MFTKRENGAEVEMTEVVRYESGAEVGAEGVYTVKNGAEEQVWSAMTGVPPINLYATSTMNSAGILPYINGDTIYLPCMYTASTGYCSRICALQIPSGLQAPKIHIDRILLPGDVGLSGTVTLYAFLYSGNMKSGTPTTNAIIQQATLFTGSIASGNSIENVDYTFTAEITKDCYLFLIAHYTESNYDATYFRWEIPLYIYELQVDDVKIVGDMTGVYES